MSETPIAPEKLLPIYGKIFLIGHPQNESSVEFSKDDGANSAPRPTETRHEQPAAATATSEPNPGSQNPETPPNQEAVTQAKAVQDDDALKWKAPREPILSFIIPKSDYESPACMQLLKKISDALKLPRRSAAFGKLSGELTPELLHDAPSERIVYLSDAHYDESFGTKSSGKTLYHVPSLERMLTDTDAKSTAWTILKPLQHGT